MKLTPTETTGMMNTTRNGIHNLFLDTFAVYGDETQEKRVEIAEFLGSFLVEITKAYTEYFTKFK